MINIFLEGGGEYSRAGMLTAHLSSVLLTFACELSVVFPAGLVRADHAHNVLSVLVLRAGQNYLLVFL